PIVEHICTKQEMIAKAPKKEEWWGLGLQAPRPAEPTFTTTEKVVPAATPADPQPVPAPASEQQMLTNKYDAMIDELVTELSNLSFHHKQEVKTRIIRTTQRVGGRAAAIPLVLHYTNIVLAEARWSRPQFSSDSEQQPPRECWYCEN